METETKVRFAGERRRRTLSLPSQLCNAKISSDKEDMSWCQLKVKFEKSDENSAHQKQGDGSSSPNPIDQVVIKSECGPPDFTYTLRYTTPRKTKANIEPMEFNKEKRKWTKEERMQLIGILNTKGYDGNIKYLASNFPGHSVDSLRYFFSSMVNPKKDDWEMSLDRYIKIIKNDHGPQSFGENLPLFVDCQSKFGKHPCPSEVGGVNYALIYQSIVFFMHGGIPKKLDENSQAKLYLLVKQLRKNLRNHFKHPTTEPKKTSKKNIKTRQEKNEHLAERRSGQWSDGEWAARAKALSKDIHVVRRFFFSHDCFNPFMFPID